MINVTQKTAKKKQKPIFYTCVCTGTIEIHHTNQKLVIWESLQQFQNSRDMSPTGIGSQLNSID